MRSLLFFKEIPYCRSLIIAWRRLGNLRQGSLSEHAGSVLFIFRKSK